MLKACRTSLSLSIKIAQQPYMIGSLGPSSLKHESLEAEGMKVEARKVEPGSFKEPFKEPE